MWQTRTVKELHNRCMKPLQSLFPLVSRLARYSRLRRSRVTRARQLFPRGFSSKRETARSLLVKRLVIMADSSVSMGSPTSSACRSCLIQAKTIDLGSSLEAFPVLSLAAFVLLSSKDSILAVSRSFCSPARCFVRFFCLTRFKIRFKQVVLKSVCHVGKAFCYCFGEGTAHGSEPVFDWCLKRRQLLIRARCVRGGKTIKSISLAMCFPSVAQTAIFCDLCDISSFLCQVGGCSRRFYSMSWHFRFGKTFTRPFAMKATTQWVRAGAMLSHGISHCGDKVE